MDLYAQLPQDHAEVRDLELACLQEAAREEALALLEEGDVVPGPFQNPAVRVEGQQSGTEVVRYLVNGETA